MCDDWATHATSVTIIYSAAFFEKNVENLVKLQ